MTIHTRQLQQYTQDNYNNTHKTTTTIHTRQLTTIHKRQLQQYAQENYNNTHKTTTTIHTRQQQQYTQDNYNNTHKTNNNNTHKTTTIHTRHLQQYLHQEDFRLLRALGCCTVYDSVLISGGPGSSGGIATGYGLDGPGIKSRSV